MSTEEPGSSDRTLLGTHVYTQHYIYLFEGELYGLILPLFKHIHEINDGLVVSVELVLAGSQSFLSLRETHKLFKGLLVHVAILLQLCVTLVKLFPQLYVFVHVHIMCKMYTRVHGSNT